MDYKQINTPKPKMLWRLLFLVGLFLILTPFIAPKIERKIEEAKQEGKTALEESGFMVVKEVIGGDTIELITGEKVKYLGVVAPDLEANECYTVEALNKNKELLGGYRVKLVAGGQDQDESEFLLRYVYLPDGTFVNLELLKGGFVDIDASGLGAEFKEEFETAVLEAKEAEAGRWGECEVSSE